MGKISQLRKRSNSYVKNLPRTIERVINVDVAEDLKLLQKQQLRASKMPDGKNITNKQTGRADYHPSYKAWKSRFFSSSYGDGKINLLLKGNLDDRMTIKATGMRYRYFTNVPYAAKLISKYGDFLSGLAPFKQPTAKSITTRAIAKDYKSKVFSR